MSLYISKLQKPSLTFESMLQIAPFDNCPNKNADVVKKIL